MNLKAKKFDLDEKGYLIAGEKSDQYKVAASKSSKLTILAYSDENCTDFVSQITAQINPETVSRKHSLSFSQAKEENSDSKPPTPPPPDPYAELGITKPGNPALNMQTVSFELMVDSTGLIDETKVVDFIETFKETCYYYRGASHGISYLKLVWGNVFLEQIVLLKFRLSSLDVQYLLFDATGEPLRAKLTCSFTQFLSTSDIENIKNTSSPDLTHMKVVRDGDSLPLMSQEVYRDPKYYMQVAKVNNMTSIHQLNRGQRLIFPPFEQ